MIFLNFVNIKIDFRKEKILMFLKIVGNFGTGWHTAEGDISSAYRSFSNEKIFGRMGINIGLSQVRISKSVFRIRFRWGINIGLSQVRISKLD